MENFFNGFYAFLNHEVTNFLNSVISGIFITTKIKIKILLTYI